MEEKKGDGKERRELWRAGKHLTLTMKLNHHKGQWVVLVEGCKHVLHGQHLARSCNLSALKTLVF